MKKKSIVLSLSLMTMLLSACGGGGGGSSQPQTAPSPTTPQTVNQGQAFANQANFSVVATPAQFHAEVQKAVQFTNQLRTERGLPALKYDAKLAAYAQHRATEIVGRFSHTRPNGQDYGNVLTGLSGENIAAGSNNAHETVLKQWRESQGHYENMVRPTFKTIGIGVVHVPGSEYGYYWVQIFGNENTQLTQEFASNPTPSTLSSVSANIGSIHPKTQWLQVDGKNIQLHHVRGDGSWQDFSQHGYNGKVAGYDDMRFGVVRQGSANYQVFYNGNNTLNENEARHMPETGSANYTGKAIMTDGKTLNTNLDARFQADFGQKKLSGHLSEQGKKVLDIQANISGATFRSSANAPVETQGAFFGSKAQEIGGVFYENATGKYGAFGAKQ